MIKRGESGYYRPSLNGGYMGNESYTGRQYADDLNTRLEVTRAQEEAMKVGSMFGWEAPGANPDCYTEEVIEKMKQLD